jgi:hypothetical protein
MSGGYGRGFYGSEQLEQKRSSSGWFKIAAVVGIGAAAWFLWPRLRGARNTVTLEQPPQLPHVPYDQALEQFARSRGFASTRTYEDAVVASARDLRAAGAVIDLGPYLQHLKTRLDS